MTVLRRGLFIVLGAATAATTLGGWTASASTQPAKKVSASRSPSKGKKGTGSGSGSTGSGSAGSGSTGTGSTGSGSTTVQYFPVAAVWTQDVSSAPVDPQSATIINSLASTGGWGTGSMRVDFSIRVMQANASTPTVPFRPGPNWDAVDSDQVSAVPLPPGGGMEGQTGYQCDPSQEDCHFIVVNNDTGKLYEAWGANYDGSALSANLLAVWDLNQVYPVSAAETSAPAPTPPAIPSPRCCSPRTNSRKGTSTMRSASSCRTARFAPESSCTPRPTPAARRARPRPRPTVCT